MVPNKAFPDFGLVADADTPFPIELQGSREKNVSQVQALAYQTNSSKGILPLEEVQVAQFFWWILTHSYLLVIEDYPLPAFEEMADVMPTGGVSTHVTDEPCQPVVALSILKFVLHSIFCPW